MNKLDSQIILQTNKSEASFINNKDFSASTFFPSINGFLSFYKIKPLSKTPILENIKIKGVLKDDGTFSISIKEEEFIQQLDEVTETFKCKYGLRFTLFPGTTFFKGSFMDGFEYNELSENISTYIINGDMVSFNKAKRFSSIGELKKVENTIHLNSSVIFKCTNDIKLQKRSKLNFIGIDISMQFKKNAA